jgi:hypothetical protein
VTTGLLVLAFYAFIMIQVGVVHAVISALLTVALSRRWVWRKLIRQVVSAAASLVLVIVVYGTETGDSPSLVWWTLSGWAGYWMLFMGVKTAMRTVERRARRRAMERELTGFIQSRQ